MKQFFLSLKSPEIYPRKISDDKVLLWWIIFWVLARLWLVEAQDLIATYTPHDDHLFVLLARHILNGNWLGPYDQFTLIKGPGYPLFIAFANYASLPLLFAQHLLYSLICIIVIAAMRPFVKQSWPLMIIFVFLLLNPMMFDYPISGRVFRLGLSMPLVLAVFACMLGLFVRLQNSFSSRLLWTIGLGFFFSLLWFTREEGIWLLPSLALFFLLFCLANAEKPVKHWLQKIVLVGVVASLFMSFQWYIEQSNKAHYGKAILNEIKAPEFQSALGGLMRIDTKTSKRYVPVSDEAEQLAFSVSPTFKLLKLVLDKKRSDIMPNFYIWKFRDAVRVSGYSNTLPEALDFYRKMGKELKSACDNGEIPCLDKEATIAPPWKAEYNKLIPEYFSKFFIRAISFCKYDSETNLFFLYKSDAPSKMVRDYKYVTGERILSSFAKKIRNYPNFYNHLKQEKFRNLNNIADMYKSIVPILFWIALAAHLFLIGRGFLKKQLRFDAVMGLVILGGLISLVAVLTYVGITLWQVGRPLFSAYPIVLLYISFIFISTLNIFTSRPKADTNKF